MSQTRDEELGRRRFQLVKEQAVEDAVEKIRRAQAVDWPSLCAADCMLLREILGELWICLEREKWEQVPPFPRSRSRISAISLHSVQDCGITLFPVQRSKRWRQSSLIHGIPPANHNRIREIRVEYRFHGMQCAIP